MNFHKLRIRGVNGKIKFQGLNIGWVKTWEFNFNEAEPEVQVDSYFFNKIWYEHGKWLELDLDSAGKGYWQIEARPQGRPQTGRIMNSRIIFETKEPLKFIKGG